MRCCHRGRLPGVCAAFTLIELLVVISIIAILAAIALRDKGTVLWGCPTWQGSTLASGALFNARTGYGMNDVPDHDLDAAGNQIAGTANGFDAGQTSFQLSRVSLPSRRLLVADSNDWHVQVPTGWPYLASRSSLQYVANSFLGGPRHRGNLINVVFFDGHVESRTVKDANTAYRNPDSLP